MSFLTPLYIAGLAAIGLPLLFHLIRRTPRGQTPFSSLMFLTPSPPRITRRSRLDNLLLLFLRGLALALLALAFARPFFRETANFQLDSTQGQRVAILVDASASMRRSDLWRQAQRGAAAVFGELKPTDRVALFVFDREVRTLMDFDDQTEIDPRRRISLVKRRLQETTPTWSATDLGHALAIVADRLDSLDRGKTAEADLRRRLVLVSDLQQGARLDALQAYEWPRGVELEVRPLAPSEPTNAGIHLAGGGLHFDEEGGESSERSFTASGGSARAADFAHRVRVANNSDSTAEQFQLVWRDANDRAVGDPIQVYVPPGQTRVISVPRPSDSPDLRLTLDGDAHAFDNNLYLAPPTREEISVVYLGEDDATDPNGLRYYVERAFPTGPRRRVRVTVPKSHEPISLPDAAAPRLVVIAQSLTEERRQELRRYLERGGQALLVATDAATAEAFAPLLAPISLAAEEAAPADYALLGELDFTHPLLAPFADPKYSDFTKIHFWKHRRLTFDEPGDDRGDGSSLRVLARFDNGDPALLEQAVGAGRAYLLAASWAPEDSQLARSSKFVPLLLGLVGAADSSDADPLYVGDGLPIPSERSTAASVLLPDGTEIAVDEGAGEFRETNVPGVYVVGNRRFAVNLDPAESQTAPRSVEELEQHGVRLTSAAKRRAEDERKRQLRDVELENRQKIWRWLVAAALVVLVVETWLAGRRT